MLFHLPHEILLIIYNYTKETLILDKEFYKFLINKRKIFFDNPLKLKFRLALWEYKEPWPIPTKYSIINCYTSKLKPRMKIKKKIYDFELPGFIPLGIIKDDIIIPHKKLSMLLIPENAFYNEDRQYADLNTLYWSVWKLWPENLERVELYNSLWI
jgi:hypothetical protein